MVLKVAQVGPGFEIVAPTIGNDAAVQDVDFTDAPAVEPRLLEQVLKNAIRTDLHVSNPCAKTPYS